MPPSEDTDQETFKEVIMDEEQMDEHIEEKKPSIAQRIGFALGSRMPSAMSVAPLTPVPAQDGEEGEAEGNIADLFEGPQPEDNDMQTEHLTSVDDEDVFGDGGEEGLEEVLEVTEEDILGDAPTEKPKFEPKAKVARAVNVPPRLTGMR